MTQHLVLTRSAYGPEWPLTANRRRLEVTRAVTARLMAAQTMDDFTWVVLLHEDDRLLKERLAVFDDGAAMVRPILWRPPTLPEKAPWDKAQRTTAVQRIAASAYRAAWRTDYALEPMLQTRLDDDDGLAVDALARVRAAARGLARRTALMQPVGFRVWQGRYSRVRHTTNAMHTLWTPEGDMACVYDYGHRKVAQGQPVVIVDEEPAWLWVRHQDTISGWKRADKRIPPGLKRLFPIDWDALW